jgi:hypothetical protein
MDLDPEYGYESKKAKKCSLKQKKLRNMYCVWMLHYL